MAFSQSLDVNAPYKTSYVPIFRGTQASKRPYNNGVSMTINLYKMLKLDTKDLSIIISH